VRLGTSIGRLSQALVNVTGGRRRHEHLDTGMFPLTCLGEAERRTRIRWGHQPFDQNSWDILPSQSYKA